MMIEHWKINDRLIELASVIAYTEVLAFLQWMRNVDRLKQREPSTLIKYLLIHLMCFSIVLLVVRKLWNATRRPLLRRPIVAVLGAVVSTLLVEVAFHNWLFYDDLLIGVIFWGVVNCFIALLIMVIIDIAGNIDVMN